jgi:hypothetical protein
MKNMKTLIKRYEIEIKGTTPVVYNRMKKEIEDEKKKLKKNELAEYEEKNWIKKAEIKDKDVILPPEWLKSMLINACKKTRLVPHFETKKNATYTQYMQGVLIQHKPSITIAKKKDLKQLGGFYPSQPNRANSGKIWKIFPQLEEGWSAKFTLIDPFGRMKQDELQELMEYGGMFIGIGDQRPMNFGRFEVISINNGK